MPRAAARPKRSKGYDKYLLSKAWRSKRHQKLALNPTCEACGSKTKLHIHHRTYERFGAELMEDLRTLCEGHHTVVHQLADRVSLAAATDEVIAMAPVLKAKRAKPAPVKARTLCYGDLKRLVAPKTNAYQRAIIAELKKSKPKKPRREAARADVLAENMRLRAMNDRRRAAGRL